MVMLIIFTESIHYLGNFSIDTKGLRGFKLLYPLNLGKIYPLFCIKMARKVNL
jgi:hypothetical protein